MSKSALSTLLEKNTLINGDNFVNWKRNLYLVLTFEKLKWVIDTPCPAEPDAKTSNDTLKAYQDWKDANDMARCYVMASISNVLQAQHEDYDNTSDIIANLVDMFEGQVATKGQAVLR